MHKRHRTSTLARSHQHKPRRAVIQLPPLLRRVPSPRALVRRPHVRLRHLEAPIPIARRHLPRRRVELEPVPLPRRPRARVPRAPHRQARVRGDAHRALERPGRRLARVRASQDRRRRRRLAVHRRASDHRVTVSRRASNRIESNPNPNHIAPRAGHSNRRAGESRARGSRDGRGLDDDGVAPKPYTLYRSRGFRANAARDDA